VRLPVVELPFPGSPEAGDRIAALDRAVTTADPGPAILQALADPSTLVRERAIALAARHLTTESLTELLRDDANAVVRNTAIAALERQGPYAVPCLVKLTGDANSEVATFAVQILANICDTSTSHALLPLLEHPHRNIAQSAIEALGSMHVVEALPTLVQSLTADPWLQFAAVSALGKLGDPRAVAPLLDLLDNELLQEPAIEALGRIASAEALAPLLERLFETDRIPLRDQLLRAVATILEHGRPDRSLLTRVRRTHEAAAQRSGLEGYLRGLLEADHSQLGRAAASVVVHLEIWELLPVLLLRSADPEEARWIAGVLRRFPRRSQAALVGLLGSPDLRVRRGVLTCGSFDRRALPVLLACLEDAESEVRAEACRAIGALRDSRAIPALLGILRSPTGPERTAAVQALGRMPGLSLEALAPDLAPSAEPHQILAALEILAAARSTELAAEVTGLVQHASAAVRRAALRVVAQHRKETAEDRLIGALDDPDHSVRMEAVELLVRRGCRRAEDNFIRLLGVDDPLRYHLIRGLGRLRVTRAAEPLMELYPRASQHERIEIVAALNNIDAPGLMDFLRRRLEEPDIETRRVASDGLARRASPAEADDLLALVDDADWTVRNHAAWGMGRLGLPLLREPLLLLARDVEPVVARTARASLGKLARESSSDAG
jgi:HEAT repeat protein